MSEEDDQVNQKEEFQYPQQIENYLIGKTIGEGTFGKVKIGVHIPTQAKVAIKILEKQKILDDGDIIRVKREISILKALKHPFVISLYQIIETLDKIFLIMEYCGNGELFDHIVKNQRLDEYEACLYFRQIILGIEYIHKLQIVHRDLKPENLLLDHNNRLKMVDFGLSNTYKHNEKLTTACGSPCYAAPEMISGLEYNGIEVDIWSSGVILFAMLCGKLPFEDPDTAQLYQMIINGIFDQPDYLSLEAKDLLLKVLNTDPKKRYTIQEIKKHDWWNCVKINEKENKGILFGIDEIQINKHVLQSLQKYDIDPIQTEQQIKSNIHSNSTATYYLLLRNFLGADLKQGKIQEQYKRNFQPREINKPQESLSRVKDLKQYDLSNNHSNLRSEADSEYLDMGMRTKNQFQMTNQKLKKQCETLIVQKQIIDKASTQKITNSKFQEKLQMLVSQQNYFHGDQMKQYKIKQQLKCGVDKFLQNYSVNAKHQFHQLTSKSGQNYSIYLPYKMKINKKSIDNNQIKYLKLSDGQSIEINQMFRVAQQIPSNLIEIQKSNIFPKLMESPQKTKYKFQKTEEKIEAQTRHRNRSCSEALNKTPQKQSQQKQLFKPQIVNIDDQQSPQINYQKEYSHAYQIVVKKKQHQVINRKRDYAQKFYQTLQHNENLCI